MQDAASSEVPRRRHPFPGVEIGMVPAQRPDLRRELEIVGVREAHRDDDKNRRQQEENHQCGERRQPEIADGGTFHCAPSLAPELAGAEQQHADDDEQHHAERAGGTPIAVAGDVLLDLHRNDRHVAAAQELRGHVEAEAEHEGEQAAGEQSGPESGTKTCQNALVWLAPRPRAARTRSMSICFIAE